MDRSGFIGNGIVYPNIHFLCKMCKGKWKMYQVRWKMFLMEDVSGKMEDVFDGR
jgi:hypothetical protein